MGDGVRYREAHLGRSVGVDDVGETSCRLARGMRWDHDESVDEIQSGASASSLVIACLDAAWGRIFIDPVRSRMSVSCYSECPLSGL